MGFTDNVLAILKRDEGFSSKPYKDSIGILTIGYGTNLDEGISEPEGAFMLANRFQEALTDLRRVYPQLTTLDDVRFAVIGMMTYNMGIHRVAQFKDMIAALYAGDVKAAAAAGRDSLWYKQVGARGERLMQMLESGQWPSDISGSAI